MADWLSGETTYEGFPLLLRRPAEINVESLRTVFQNLVVVTHVFTHRKPNGLPESNYNKELADLDHELITVFDQRANGFCVLIETYGGERNYYYYVVPNADVSALLDPILLRYLTEKLTISTESDPEWNFFQKYAKDFF